MTVMLKLIARKAKLLHTFMDVVNNTVQFLAHIGSLGLGVFAAMGAASSGRGSSFVIDVNGMPFSLRFVIMAVIAAAMGWGLGAGVSWLTRDRSEKHMAFGVFLALITGGLMVFSADWLAIASARSRVPELELFVGAGMLVAFWVAAYNFRMHAEGADQGVLKGRAAALFTFAVVAVFLLLLSMLGEM